MGERYHERLRIYEEVSTWDLETLRAFLDENPPENFWKECAKDRVRALTREQTPQPATNGRRKRFGLF